MTLEIDRYEQALKDLGFTETVRYTRGLVVRTITIGFAVSFTGSLAECVAFVAGWKARAP